MFDLGEKNKWFKVSSISGDYTRFSLVIISSIILMCFFAAFSNYFAYIQNTRNSLRSSAQHVDIILSDIFDETKQMMTYLGKQIVKAGQEDLHSIERILESTKTLEHEISPILSWSGFDWINSAGRQVINIKGRQNKPLDFSKIRNYTEKCKLKPWKMFFAEPGAGVPSKRWIIPVGLGITDEDGVHIGIVSAGVEISAILKRMQISLKDHNVKFLVFDEANKILLQSENYNAKHEFIEKISKRIVKASGFIEEPTPLKSDEIIYYQKMENYPFVIITEYESDIFSKELLFLIKGRVYELLFIGLSMVVLLFFFQKKIINPVKELSNIAVVISNGGNITRMPKINSKETFYLARTLLKIKRYIRNIENYKNRLEISNQQLQTLNNEINDTKRRLEEYAEIAEMSDVAREKFIDKVTNEANLALEMISSCCNFLIKQIESDDVSAISKEKQLWIIKQIYKTSINIPLLTLDIVNIDELDLLATFQECIMIHSKNAALNGIKINFYIVSDIRPFYANELRFKQMILGFMARSLKYSSENSQVSIYVKTIVREDKASCLEVVFSEEGFGIGAGEVQRLTNKFSKEFKPRVSVIELEDSTLNRLLEMHQGDCKIESELGKGTSIVITLPFPEKKSNKLKKDEFLNFANDNY